MVVGEDCSTAGALCEKKKMEPKVKPFGTSEPEPWNSRLEVSQKVLEPMGRKYQYPVSFAVYKIARPLQYRSYILMWSYFHCTNMKLYLPKTLSLYIKLIVSFLNWKFNRSVFNAQPFPNLWFYMQGSALAPCYSAVLVPAGASPENRLEVSWPALFPGSLFTS